MASGWLPITGRLLVHAALVALAAAPSTVRAETVTLEAAKDNTLFENPSGALSNGAGEHIFAGRTAVGLSRRALIAFNLAASVPSGATITGATLRLYMSWTISNAQDVALHRATQAWGEGASDAPDMEGAGAPSEPGDATWIHTYYPGASWASAGGDFLAAASATTSVDQADYYQWTSPALAADVQSWLDVPSTNHGWILIGNEGAIATAKRFGSRQSSDPAVRPVLVVDYTGGATPSGRVPDGASLDGPLLTVGKAGQPPGTDLVLSWGASCRPTDTDYEVYAGTIGNFTGHAPVVCSTEGTTTATIPAGSGNRYYLVVPRNAGREGSYGVTSNLVERPQGTPSCLPQATGSCT